MTQTHAIEDDDLRRRATRGYDALRTTDDTLASAIAAIADPSDVLALRLARHREAGAHLIADARALCATLDHVPDAETRVKDLELSVQRFIVDVTVDELSRKISHGEE